jgi:cell shape-determining protein MreD
VYSLYRVYFDITYVPDIPGKVKHANKFLFVLIVYGIGTLTLRRYMVAWMMLIWHLIHIIFISSLLLIGFYDWLHGDITEQIRNVANSVFEFLISPVLYVSMGIVQFRLFKNKELI